MSSSASTPNGRERAFITTRWTRVLAARGDSPEAKRALGELCEAYWPAVFRFLQREGRTEDTARELAQEFFAKVLERDAFAGVDPARGRFRSFLLGALKHFLGDQRDRDRAAKRGGGAFHESIGPQTDTSPGIEIADPSEAFDERRFDRQWALAVIDRSMSALETELRGDGKAVVFEVLKPWLAGDAVPMSQAEAGQRLGLSEGAVKVAVHRLRLRYRELVRAEVAQTVPETSDVDTELRYLVEVLAT